MQSGMRTLQRVSMIVVTLWVGAFVPGMANAQVLEEVTVTATRRGDTDILTTPVAVTALTGEQIETFGIRDLNDIAVSVPGLSGGTVAAFKSAQFALRGVSETTIIVYKESPIGVIIDDFVVPHIQSSNLEMFDVEAIEVLRGPQGTLFGKNTTGGVINVRTKRPVINDKSVDLRLKLGDFGTQQLQTAINVPFGDNWAFRFAGMKLESDGYYKNNATFGPLGAGPAPVDPTYAGLSGQGDGRDLGGDDVFSARAKLLWEPSDNFNMLFQYEIIRDKGDTPPIVAESGEGYLFPVWGYPAATGDPLDNAGNTLRDDLLLNLTSGHRVDIDGFYLSAEWDLGNYSILANTGIREQESRLPSSYAGSPGPVSLFDATRDDNRETSQFEIRLVSDLDGPWNFVAGAFTQSDDTEFCVLQVVGFLDNFFLGTPPAFFNNNPLILCNAQEASAIAGFVDGTWDITDRAHLTLGLRYTKEEKSWAGRPRINVFALDGAPTLAELGTPLNAVDFDRFPSLVVRDSETWEEPTYRVNFAYDFNDDWFGYANYSRGFKSGGYNDQIGTQLNPITPLAARPTDPEIADSFEAGVRASILGGSASFGATLFHVKYTDAQRTLNATFPTGQETLFFNAAELTTQGLELDGSWAATERLTFSGNLAWTDAEFDTFEADTNFDGVNDVDFSNQPVTRAPELMYTIDAKYRQELPRYGDLDWNVRVAYEDESVASYSDVAPEFNAFLNERTLVDASVTFTDKNDNYFVRLFGKNLTDERYRTGSLSVATLWIMSAYGPPRWFGVEFGANFDFN
ncbi:MAG: TonB-dependent receptor [Gammaproteobacteria bacterium]